MEQITQSLNQFGFELFRNVYSQSTQTGESTVLSNISVFIALLMTMAGTRDETRNEFLKTLKLNGYKTDSKNQEQTLVKLHESIRSLSKLLITNETSNQVIIANKMIVNKLKIKNSFENLVKTVYESSIDSVYSSESFESVVRETNKWISELTNNKISSILDESFKTVALTLINAIYFNCEWLYEFDQTKTQKRAFHSSINSEKQIEMMELSNKKFLYHYSESLKAHLLSVPYKNEKYFFDIILPTNDQDFLEISDKNSLINRLDYQTLKEEINNQVYETINLSMPKFIIKKKINLNEILKNLGITLAFDSKKADFGDLAETNGLFISEVN